MKSVVVLPTYWEPSQLWFSGNVLWTKIFIFAVRLGRRIGDVEQLHTDKWTRRMARYHIVAAEKRSRSPGRQDGISLTISRYVDSDDRNRE